MANLTVDAARVGWVRGDAPIPHKAGATVTAGAPVYLDSNGAVREADAGADATEAAIGIALKSVVAGEALSVAGGAAIVDLGNALGGLAFGATVYLSDDAGELADAAGSATVAMGTVIPGHGQTTADKLLRVNPALVG